MKLSKPPRPVLLALVTLFALLATLLSAAAGAPAASAATVAWPPAGALETPAHQVLLPMVLNPPGPPPLPYRLVPDSAVCVPNAGVGYYQGVVRDRSGALKNAVCVHLAFFGPRTTKCSGCDGVGDGNWGFSPYGGPAPANYPVEIFIVPCPAYVPPGGQNSDFGDLTPLSDKWLFTTGPVSMQCTGITFQEN